MNKVILAATTILTLSAPILAHAESTDIAALEAKIERLERVLNKMVKTQEAQPTVSLRPGLRVVSADKAYSFGIDGFVQADTGWISGGHADLPNSATISRARLGVKGIFAHDWQYRILTDFAKDDFMLIDAEISYTGFENVKLTTGQFREPFGLENFTAAKYWTFAEKASTGVLAPKRAVGVGGTYYYGQGLISMGAFGETTYKHRNDDEGHGFTARVTYFPVDNSEQLLHLGLSATYREPDAETNALRFKSKGHTTFTPIFVDTGNIADADSFVSINPEVAYINGPFSVQGEYNTTRVARESNADLNFSAYYGEVSYFITGESRHYNKKRGAFGKLKPDASLDLKNNAFGAVQVAYRYDYLDLSDGDVTGGELSSHTLGLNWMPNDYTRFSGNVIYADTSNDAAIANENATIFMLRSQFEF